MPKRRYKKYAISIDGHLYSASFLGKGQYSKVYQVGDRAVYYTKDDCTKEALAMFYYGGIPHLPEIIRHDNISSGYTHYQVFSSPIYRNVKRTDTSAYRLMKKLIKFHDLWWRKENQSQAYRRIRNDVTVMQRFVNDVRSSGQFPYSIVKALQAILEISRNCGDYIAFDLVSKNFGVNEYGTLIFRDVVYVVVQ
jgi:hypothetical protein